MALSKTGAELLLFEIFSRRYELGSTLPVLFQDSAARESVKLAGVSVASDTSFSVDVSRFGPRAVNAIPKGVPEPASGPVARRGRLGGILSHYYREAA